MSDGEENADTRHSCEDEQQLEKEIDKEIHKLKYFLDETDELIKLRDYTEMDIANRQVEKIVCKLSDLISQVEELKIDHGVSARSVRIWKKDVKATVFHVSYGQRKACEVLKQQTRGYRRGNGKKTI